VEREDYWEAFKKLIRHVEFIKILLVTGLVIGSFNGIAGVLAFFVEPFNIGIKNYNA